MQSNQPSITSSPILLNLPEDWYGTVANCTCGNTAHPVSLLALQTQPLCACASGDDDGISGLGFLVFLHLSPVPERAGGEVELGNGFCDDVGSEADRLFAELVHEFGAHDASGETGKVFDCAC